jgi:hypothetical protein
VVIYILYKLYTKIKIRGRNYHQRKLANSYAKLTGNTPSNASKDIIAMESMPNKSALDHYFIGNTYLIMNENHKKAEEHFKNALKSIVETKNTTDEHLFVIDGIRDAPGITAHDFDIPLQEAMFAEIERRKSAQPPAISKNTTPAAIIEKIENKKVWISDSQNVHDATINDALNAQLAHLRGANREFPDAQYYTYEDAVMWIRAKFANDKSKLERANKVFNILEHNYNVPGIGVHEKDLLAAVWKRAHDPRNAKNRDSFKDAIADSIIDCVEGGNVVCINGRTPKIWQSMAQIDYENLGVLKSKQFIRNEIYDKAGQIVKRYTTPGIIKKETIDDFINNRNTADVKDLTENIKKDIRELRAEYHGKLPEEQLKIIVEECIDGV